MFDAHGETFFWQQDGAPAHKANLTEKFLDDENIPFWRRGVWPGNSPDLSSVENVWPLLQAACSPPGGEPCSKLAMRRRISKFLREFPVSACRNLLDSFPRRIQACIDADYYTIDY